MTPGGTQAGTGPGQGGANSPVSPALRHSRQARFAPVGEAGQARIAAARVLLVGCGALGTHLAEFCVRAGVGSLAIVDRDFVEFSNLQRQSLFTEADARNGTPKAVAAARALAAIDSSVVIRPVVADFTHENAEELAVGFSGRGDVSGGGGGFSGGSAGVATLVLDATDNFETRFLVNDLACELGIPWVYAGCVGSRAVCMPVVPGETACLACVLEDVPPASGESCETTGIIMPAVLAAVSMASAEAMKLMLAEPGLPHSATISRMRTVDIWTGELAAISASHPRRDCPVCSGGARQHLSGRAGDAAVRLCGRNAVQLRPAARLDAAAFARLGDRLAAAGWEVVARNEFLVRIAGVAGGGGNDHKSFRDFDAPTSPEAPPTPPASGAVPGNIELTIFADGRMLVAGTEDFAAARAFASRVVG